MISSKYKISLIVHPRLKLKETEQNSVNLSHVNSKVVNATQTTRKPRGINGDNTESNT